MNHGDRLIVQIALLPYRLINRPDRSYNQPKSQKILMGSFLEQQLINLID